MMFDRIFTHSRMPFQKTEVNLLNPVDAFSAKFMY